MKQDVFKSIYEQLKRGSMAEYTAEIDGAQYVRRWTPRERLIILGGGHIALPLCTVSALLGFSVTVVDDRPSFAYRQRFPEAEQVVCDNFVHALDALHVTAHDYVCVITRGHQHDGVCLQHILTHEMPKYVGMIGSRRRTSAQLRQFAEEGIPQERLDAVNTPIGIEIDAQTTQEIAVSIAAQLIQYRRRGEQQRLTHEPILDQTNIDEAVLRTLMNGGGTQVLAMVIETKGSTPVKSGALMCVDACGAITGTIGGGCGESAVMREARFLAGKHEREIFTVDMSNDIAADEGMVCGGTMRVLLESVES